METNEKSGIAEVFRELRANGRIALIPFLPAGFPNFDTTIACARALTAAGASIIEIGFPFSDPIADGPVIQEAFTASLARGLRIGDIFPAVAAVKDSVPLVAMVSYSLVFRRGVERFCADAAQAGFRGLILPDLPPPEAEPVCRVVGAAGLDPILLVAPTTSPERRREIARLSRGFIYYLSIAGITGERAELPPELAAGVRDLRSLTDRPVCVGFGIHQARHLAQLRGVADGAIVGTAYVRRIREHQNESPEKIAEILGDYTRELLSEVR